jgi:hypothetical protein
MKKLEVKIPDHVGICLWQAAVEKWVKVYVNVVRSYLEFLVSRTTLLQRRGPNIKHHAESSIIQIKECMYKVGLMYNMFIARH